MRARRGSGVALAVALCLTGAWARAAEPGYRFRGDDPARAASPSPADGFADQGYRFRPLDARERDRFQQQPGWRAPEPAREAGVRPPALIETLRPSVPGASVPGEMQAPPPWR